MENFSTKRGNAKLKFVESYLSVYISGQDTIRKGQDTLGYLGLFMKRKGLAQESVQGSISEAAPQSHDCCDMLIDIYGPGITCRTVEHSQIH